MITIHARDTCAMCGNYLDDDLKCYECEDCNMKHSTEDAFDVFTGDYDSTDGEFDPVNRPPHYAIRDGIECIDYMRQVLGLQGFIDYCHGNVIKYQHRYNYKGKPVEDMQKAQYYLNKMIEALKEKHR
tara:strand:+ start:307 stop:690 length:384 start_codon:yes stop_codon:yes gene_type:complete